MKIGVVGWYGYKNHGDDRILECMRNAFEFHDMVVFKGWDDAKQRIDEINRCDYVLIGGGGLILRDASIHADFISAIRRPFGFVGISIEENHRSMRNFLSLMKKRADFIMVRDRESCHILNDYYKVITSSDLTFLNPLDVVKVNPKESCGLNMRDWYYWQAQLHSPFHRLMHIADRRIPSMKKVYPFKKWNPDRMVEIVKNNFKEILPVPLYFDNAFRNDKVVLSEYFNDVPQQFNPANLGKVRYIVGMRYHSLVYATQCGLPFVALAYQPKCRVFCKEAGLDRIVVDIYNPKGLSDAIHYIKDNHGAIRKKILQVRERNSKDVQYCIKTISGLIEDTKPIAKMKAGRKS